MKLKLLKVAVIRSIKEYLWFIIAWLGALAYVLLTNTLVNFDVLLLVIGGVACLILVQTADDDSLIKKEYKSTEEGTAYQNKEN